MMGPPSDDDPATRGELERLRLSLGKLRDEMAQEHREIRREVREDIAPLRTSLLEIVSKLADAQVEREKTTSKINAQNDHIKEVNETNKQMKFAFNRAFVVILLVAAAIILKEATGIDLSEVLKSQ